VNSDIILKYFPELSAVQKDKFNQLRPLYELWNAQINVVSRKDIDFLYERHVLHSLGIAKVCSFVDDTEILDVGTGGGFPGIPLAIMFPNVSFHLVDAVGKKIKVVEEIARELGLDNVKAEHQRVEKLHSTYDFVVSRAVTRMEPFLGWVRNKISRNHYNTLDNGILYLKGGDLEEELAEAKKKYQLYSLSDFFEEEFFDTKKVVYIPF
jgi:16S rRNA (guanine527-N7)-methyltransferase